MRFQQELQQILQVHALPSLSHTALAYLEACMLASLTQLLVRLKYLLRRLGKSAATSGVNGSSLPYGQLLLLLHLHDGARFYRLSSFLGMEEARKKARESASGVSELDMLNDNDEPTHEAENFDDAWLAAAPSAGAGGNTAASTSVGTSLNQSSEASQATIPHSILSLDLLSTYEEYSSYPLPMSAAQAHEAIIKQALPLGFLDHLRRLQSADHLTRTMSPSEYIQYSEARAQAGFTHHKLRSKRFREFITPHLAANEIPQSDELFESLAFLAQEIVVQLVEQGKTAAQKRVNDARRVETKSRGIASRVLSSSKGAQSKKKKKTQNKKAVSKAVRDQKTQAAKVGGKAPAKKPALQASKKTISTAMQREKDEKQRQLELKMEEQNRHPEGPFTAPAGSQVSLGLPAPSHSAADVDSSQNLPSNSATEHSKVDGTAPLASIAGSYDVLLGDFEQGYHDAKRDASSAAHNVKRKRRFVDIFR